MQCLREREMETVDLTQQMQTLSCSQSVPDNLSLVTNTGQDTIDKLSRDLGDMCGMVDTEMIDDQENDQEVPGSTEEKYCQHRARSDPVYIQHQQQLHLQQQQLHHQQRIQLQLELQQQQYQQQQLLKTQNPHYPSLVSHHQYICQTTVTPPQQL